MNKLKQDIIISFVSWKSLFWTIMMFLDVFFYENY